MKQVQIYLSSLLCLVVLTVLTGLVYPLITTGLAQILMPEKANGSLLIDDDGEVRGSRLLAQNFTESKYFVSRPSANSYMVLSSSGSNLGVSSKKLDEVVRARKEAWIVSFGETKIPREMLFASGSGLDPDISLESALIQVDRVAQARKIKGEKKQSLIELIKKMADEESLGLANPKINATVLNWYMDHEYGK